jgi:glycosyltransferase involved in cell wall biosynthesis
MLSIALEHVVSSMRIGFLTASLSRQGGNVSAALPVLGRSLHSLAEVDVAAFGLRDEMTDADFGTWGTVTVTAAPARGPRKFGFSRDLDLALAHADLDLLHVHGLWTYTSVACRRWADATARPYIVSPHGMLDSWAVRRSPWKKLCAALLFEFAHLRGAACLHARCKDEAQTLRTWKLQNPICIIPNAVEQIPDSLARQRRLTFLHSAGKHVLLCFGPLLHDGNLHMLLRAWQLACKESTKCESDWSLILAVPDKNGGALVRECAALGVQKTVRVASASASASRELWETAAAVVLLPAASEQTVNVLRAWSHGLPVLLCGTCSAAAKLYEAAAIAVQPTVEDVAKGLLTLVGMSEAERAALGARARRLVDACAAPAAIAEDMARVYRWALDRGPKPPCVVEH